MGRARTGIWVIWLLLFCASLAKAENVTVFAAASLKGALDEVADLWAETSGHEVTVSYAGSSVLARQILQGAPADVFISANIKWMDVLEEEGLLVPSSRYNLLENRLVLIAGTQQKFALQDLPERLGHGPLAIGFTQAVPAGIYGRQALQSLGLWQSIKGRVAQTDSVRAALNLVARGEAPYGIVYATDALAHQSVYQVLEFLVSSHAPILYPMARMNDADHVGAFTAFLAGKTAKDIFRTHGFILPRAR